MTISMQLWPISGWIDVAMLRVRKLATGVNTLTEHQPVVVPHIDMEDALILAEEVEATIRNLGENVSQIQGKGWGGTLAEMSYGLAESGASRIKRYIYERLQWSTGANVKPIDIRTLIFHQNHVTAGLDVLQILSGERTWNESKFEAVSREFNEYINNLIDLTLSTLPAIGPIYEISTGIVGYRLPDGERLSNLDRTLRIGFAAFGTVLSLGVRGVKVTHRTLQIIKTGRSLSIPISEQRGYVALALAVSKMSPKHAEYISAVIKAARNGVKLTGEQHAAVSRLLKILNQTSTATSWAKIAENPLYIKEKIGKSIVLKFVELKPGERDAIKVLEKNLGKAEIVSLPEGTPQDFLRATTKLSQTPNVEHPDILIEGLLADIYTPTTSNIRKVLAESAKKNAQATMVIINLDRTSIKVEEMVRNVPRLWGKPECMGIDRVIILNSKGFFQYFYRPNNFRLIDNYVLSPVQTLAQLREMWNKMENEHN